MDARALANWRMHTLRLAGENPRTVRDDQVRFDLRPYRQFDVGERQAVVEAAERYGAFLGRSAQVEF